MRILVADDSKNIRVVLKQLLARWDYEVVSANDGAEAWEILQNEPIRLVISDWMMPNMDGLELCRKIRAADGDDYTYFILLTARNETSDLVLGMDAGADDFVVKPFNIDELSVRIRAAQRVLDLQANLANQNHSLSEVNQELNHAYSALSRDLEAAAKIQMSLLPAPDTKINGVEFEWLFCPAAYVAGDILDVFEMDDDHVAFYHLDVTGHGVPSAMLSVTVNKMLSPDSGIYTYTDASNISPAKIVGRLNEHFQSDSDGLLYFTLIFGILNKTTGKVQLCQAGHPSPVIQVRSGDKNSQFIGTGGFPVGMLPDIEYEVIDMTLEYGDRLMLYSDGITECMKDDGQIYGDDRFIEHVSKTQDQDLLSVIEDLKAELVQWKGDEKFGDDVSVLLLERSMGDLVTS